MEVKTTSKRLNHKKTAERNILSSKTQRKKYKKFFSNSSKIESRKKSNKFDRSLLIHLSKQNYGNHSPSSMKRLSEGRMKRPKKSILRALMYSNRMFKESDSENDELIGKKRLRPSSPSRPRRFRANQVKRFFKRNYLERNFFYSEVKSNICCYFDEKKKQLDNLQKRLKVQIRKNESSAKNDFSKYFED